MISGERNGATCSKAGSIGSIEWTMFDTSVEIVDARDIEEKLRSLGL